MGIYSKKELREWLQADRQVNNITSFKDELKYTWRYLKALRWYEYTVNTKKAKPFQLLAKVKLRRWGLKTGISIDINTFGKGLYLPHYGSIVVNSSAQFGDYCILQSDVNVSANVRCGNHVYIAAGAKVLKDVEIADYCIIGANAVVTKSIFEQNVALGGVPAKIISHNGMKNREDV